MEELKISAEVGNLMQLTAFLERLGVGAVNAIMVAAEEVFVNIASYAYENGGDMIIRAGEADGVFRMEFSDEGNPFDPLGEEPPDINAERSAPGGMGIFLVRSLMDTVEYERVGGKNILRLSKRLSKSE